MALYHKTESIHYGTMSQEGSILFGAVSQEREYSLWLCVARRIVFFMNL